MEWFGANRLSKILNHIYRYIIKNRTDILGICLWSLCLKRVSFICSFVVSTIDFLTQFETNSFFFSGPCCHSFPNPVFGQLTCSTSEVGNSQLIQYIFWWNFGNFPMKSIPIPRCLMYGIFSYIYRQNVGNRPYIEHLGLAKYAQNFWIISPVRWQIVATTTKTHCLWGSFFGGSPIWEKKHVNVTTIENLYIPSSFPGWTGKNIITIH